MRMALSAIYAGEQDARRYALLGNAIVLTLFALYAAAVAGAVSRWLLPLAVVILLPRWMIYVHELFHLRSEHRVDPLNRLLLLPFTPLALGYREFRTIHFGHHRNPATADDPDSFHILGGTTRALVGALTLPEQAFWRWILRYGVDVRLGLGAVLRLATFAALALAGGIAFLWLWVPLRLVYAAGDLAFFHLLHFRHGHPGTYALTLPPVVTRLARMVYGNTVVFAVLHHDRHHRDPRVAARHLAAAS